MSLFLGNKFKDATNTKTSRQVGAGLAVLKLAGEGISTIHARNVDFVVGAVLDVSELKIPAGTYKIIDGVTIGGTKLRFATGTNTDQWSFEFDQTSGDLQLTSNVGYSIQKERHQWDLLRDYVDACHARSIRVAAYSSSTNMFIDIDTVPFDPDMLVTNLGRLRLLKGLDEGWKPVIVEFAGRRNGHRFLNYYPPLGFPPAIGECNAALASLQDFQEGLPLLHLYQRKGEVMKIAEAANKPIDL